jgi:hypothetical protein
MIRVPCKVGSSSEHARGVSSGTVGCTIVTKFYTTIPTHPASPESVVAAVSAALAPFDLNNYQREPFDPSAAWDWWSLDAGGLLTLRTEYADDPRQLRAASPPEGTGAVVAAPKFMIDFDAIRGSARRHAADAWDAWAALNHAHPGALPRSHFVAQGMPREESDREHLLQPAIQAVAQAAASQAHPYFTFQVLLADPVTYFGGDRERFAQASEDQAFATHAYLTLDGEWLSPSTVDYSWAEHARAMAAYLDSLPDDTVVAIVRCHS